MRQLWLDHTCDLITKRGATVEHNEAANTYTVVCGRDRYPLTLSKYELLCTRMGWPFPGTPASRVEPIEEKPNPQRKLAVEDHPATTPQKEEPAGPERLRVTFQNTTKDESGAEDESTTEVEHMNEQRESTPRAKSTYTEEEVERIGRMKYEDGMTHAEIEVATDYEYNQVLHMVTRYRKILKKKSQPLPDTNSSNRKPPAKPKSKKPKPKKPKKAQVAASAPALSNGHAGTETHEIRVQLLRGRAVSISFPEDLTFAEREYVDTTVVGYLELIKARNQLTKN